MLDLKSVEKVVRITNSLPEGEKLAEFRGRDSAMKALEAGLPALPESDRAAVAWFIAQCFAMCTSVPAGELSDILKDTSTGYALAAGKLMGIV